MKYCLRSALLLAFTCCILQIAQAQSTHFLPSSLSIAGTGTASDNYSAFSNPASAITDQIELGFSYENRFLLKELSLNSLYITFPTQYAQFTTAVMYTGYSLYNELMAGFAVSRQFADKFSLGVQFNYFSVYTYETNSRFGTIFPQVGAQILLSPQVKVAFNAYNPGQQVIKTEFTTKKIPAIYGIGAKWLPSESLRLLFQLDKKTDDPYRVAVGIEYTLKEILMVKMGMYNDHYLVPALGFGLHWPRFRFDLNMQLHPVLGIIPQAAVALSISKK